MSVHYKFKSSLDFDTISFDGLHISVDDLKKAIIHQRRLGKTDFDLLITNAQTKEGKFEWEPVMARVVVIVNTWLLCDYFAFCNESRLSDGR